MNTPHSLFRVGSLRTARISFPEIAIMVFFYDNEDVSA